MTRKSNTSTKLTRRNVKPKPTHPSAIPDALRDFDSLPNSAHVRLPVVKALNACSGATVWRRVKDGGLPPPRKLSPNVSGWNVGELRDALQAKAAA